MPTTSHLINIAYAAMGYIPMVELQIDTPPPNKLSTSNSWRQSPIKQRPQKKPKIKQITDYDFPIKLYTHKELESGFVFGWDYKFDVLIDHILEPSILTNQWECNIDNVNFFYELIQSDSNAMSPLETHWHSIRGMQRYQDFLTILHVSSCSWKA